MPVTSRVCIAFLLIARKARSVDINEMIRALSCSWFTMIDLSRSACIMNPIIPTGELLPTVSASAVRLVENVALLFLGLCYVSLLRKT
jgi:hypothetical protein